MSCHQNKGPQQELVMTWVWILGNLKTESVARALCQTSTPAGTTNTAPGEFICCNQTMETSQEGFWAPRDHCSPELQIQTEMLPSQNCPSHESKALVKETCFQSSSEETAKTCFLQADLGTETISRFCGSRTQKTIIQKEQHTVYKLPDQLAFNHSSLLPLMHNWLMCINQGMFIGFHVSFVCVH